MEITFNIFDSINKIIFLFETTKEKYFLSKSTFEKYIYENWELNNNIEILDGKKLNKEFCHNFKENISREEQFRNYDNKIKPTKLPLFTETKNLNLTRDKILDDINIQKFNKKIYRKIAVKSHPDKILDKEKNFLFVKANYFYENNLTIGLIFIAKKLEVEINIRNIKLIKYLLKEISFTETKIKNMQKSFYWLWNYSPLEIKKIIENKFIKENNLIKKI